MKDEGSPLAEMEHIKQNENYFPFSKSITCASGCGNVICCYKKTKSELWYAGELKSN